MSNRVTLPVGIASTPRSVAIFWGGGVARVPAQETDRMLSSNCDEPLWFLSFPVVRWPPGHEGKGRRSGKQGFVGPVSMTEIAFQETAPTSQLNFIPE